MDLRRTLDDRSGRHGGAPASMIFPSDRFVWKRRAPRLGRSRLSQSLILARHVGEKQTRKDKRHAEKDTVRCAAGMYPSNSDVS